MFGEHNIRLLIPSELIYDIDVGLIYTVREKYNDPTYFDSEYLDSMSKDNVINDLMNRTTTNPLSIISNGTLSEENLDSLYYELIEKERETIRKYSEITALGDLISALSTTAGIVSTILCRDEEEVSFFKTLELFKDFQMESKSDPKFTYQTYNTIYVKYAKDIPNTLDVKVLYFTNHRYNLSVVNNTEVYIKEIVELSKHNEIIMIDLYRRKSEETNNGTDE